jgi:hypothetical protein
MSCVLWQTISSSIRKATAVSDFDSVFIDFQAAQLAFRALKAMEKHAPQGLTIDIDAAIAIRAAEMLLEAAKRAAAEVSSNTTN